MREILQKIYNLLEYRLGELGIVLAAVPFVLIVVLIYWVLRRVWHKKRFGVRFKLVRKKARLNEVIRLLLLFWAVETVCITLFPMWFWTAVWDWMANGYHQVGELHFVPWSSEFTLWRIITEPEFAEIAFRSGVVDEMLANVMLFVPLGLGLPFVLKKVRFWKVAAAGFGCSLFIELVQPFLPRQGDIDDVICNTVGAVVGFILYLAIKVMFPRFVRKGRMTVNSAK